ncbi:MAG: hypothetical protein OZ921_11995 [Sorangiineae bacterium]|nr:hypothetical protein [Polyangiaceae bacterium]MEB2323227.1 hypothetical protein [Sorangiineae bacterium]
MYQAVSESVDPGRPAAGFLEVCERRGLGGVELVCDAAGEPARARSNGELAELRALFAERGFPIVGIYVTSLEALGQLATAERSAIVSAPIVAPRGVVPLERLAELDALYAKAGGRLLVSHGTVPSDAAELARELAERGLEHVALAWEVRPREDELARAPEVLRAAGERLEYVRLFGGGAEQASMDGLGVGSFIVALGMARYEGPLVVCPTSGEHRALWQRWLTSSKSMGCGTAAARAAERRIRITGDFFRGPAPGNRRS